MSLVLRGCRDQAQDLVLSRQGVLSLSRLLEFSKGDKAREVLLQKDGISSEHQV